jgi:hypothetical protein
MGASEPESQGQSLPVAGWYEDPSGQSGRRRYWDGTRWTDQYAGGGSAKTVGEIDRSFGALYRAAGVLHVLAWITLILGSLAVIGGTIAAAVSDPTLTRDAFGNIHERDPAGEAVAIAVFGSIAVALYTLLLFAAAAMIRLALRVEDSTYRTASAVERLAERLPAQPGT